MQRVKLDKSPAAVKKFVRSLPVEPDGVELELNGQILCKVISAHRLTEEERDKLLARGRELIRQARARSRGIPARTIEREVREAVHEVRRRRRP